MRLDAAAFLISGIVLLSAVGFFSSRSVAAPPAAPLAGPSVAVSLAIETVAGVDSVVGATLHFAVGTLVEFTIFNFDPVSVGSPASAAAPAGAFVSAPRLGIPGTAESTPLRGLDPASVSHTFTVASGNDPFNVPVPPAWSPSAPSVVTFSVYLSASGTFVWYCAAFCEDGGLGGSGEMGGSITVGPG